MSCFDDGRVLNGQHSSCRCTESDVPSRPAATEAPTFSVIAGTYHSAQTVSITDATAGAVIYFTTDGTVPIASSTPHGGPI